MMVNVYASATSPAANVQTPVPAAEQVRATPLVINGEEIPESVIASEAQNHSAPRGDPGEARRKAVNAVAMRTLLLQEAARRNLAPEPAQLSLGRFETDEEALIRALLEDAVVVAAPQEDAVRSEWERDPSRFRAPPLWEVSHLLVACDPQDKAQREAGWLRAVELNAKALDQSSGFAHLAARHSDCGSKASSGALGQIGPGDTVPEFEAVLRELAEGEITKEPVLTRHGWHIIRMDACAEGAVLPFEVVRQKISDAMEKAAWTRVARQFVDQLVAAADISGASLQKR